MVQLNFEQREHLRMNIHCADYVDTPGLGYDPDAKGVVIMVPEAVPKDKYEIILKNFEIIAERIEARSKLHEMATGDYFKMLNGQLDRVTSLTGGNGNPQHYINASFYMLSTGNGDASGIMGEIIGNPKLLVSITKKDAEFWIFSQNVSGPDRRLNFMCPVNVWEYIF